MDTTAGTEEEAVSAEFAPAGVQPGGGMMCTMLPHRGHAWISPIALALRILSRARHVSQMIGNGSTTMVAAMNRIDEAGGAGNAVPIDTDR
jgi:hypothetical protein